MTEPFRHAIEPSPAVRLALGAGTIAVQQSRDWAAEAQELYKPREVPPFEMPPNPAYETNAQLESLNEHLLGESDARKAAEVRTIRAHRQTLAVAVAGIVFAAPVWPKVTALGQAIGAAVWPSVAALWRAIVSLAQ